MNTFRLFLKLAIDRGQKLYSIDFTTAFLNAPVELDLYLTPCDGIDCPPGHLFKLERALYGLKQAGRNWNSLLIELLVKLGLKKLKADPCIYVNEDYTIMVLTYVDDCIISTLKVDDYESLVTEIEKFYKLGEKGPLREFLGISIENTTKGIFLSQRHYVERFIEKYEVQSDPSIETPMVERFNAKKDPNDELYEDFEIRRKIGSLMYLMICTRPDISFAVGKLGRYTNHPSKTICIACDHLLKYVLNTIDLGISIIKENNSKHTMWSDSDHAGDSEDGKSTSGYNSQLGSTTVSWSSHKQTITAQSSTDAEIIAMVATIKETIFLRGLLAECGYPDPLPTKIFGDNQAVFQLSTNQQYHKRTKHMLYQLSYIQENVASEHVIIEMVRSLSNIADIFTKPKPRQHFLDDRKKLFLEKR
jgi:hypothetical protein